MNLRIALHFFLLATSSFAANTMPYAPIAIASGEKPERRIADSLNTIINPIRVNQSGYLPDDPQKIFYVVGTATTFTVVLASDSSTVSQGSLSSTGTTTSSSILILTDTNFIRYDSMAGTGPSGNLLQGTLPSGLPENTPLRIRVGSDYSADFLISSKIYTYARNAVMRFFGLQQSKHHKDGMGPINGSRATLTPQSGALAGGWYDCGDHIKESQTQAYAASVLALTAAAFSEKDQDEYDQSQSNPLQTDGIPDLLAESKHGADFVLAAYDFANGVIDLMPLSIGDFGSDHGYWGPPDFQDNLPSSITGRGGPHERTVRLGELGSNISAEFAANLALVSKLYRPYDDAYASKCLMVSKELYSFAKSLALQQISPINNSVASGWSSPAYNGNNEYHDDLSLAAIALLYATEDTTYLFDAVKNPALGSPVNKASLTGTMNGYGAFSGGWFNHKEPSLFKNVKNTSWASSHAYALFAFYSLILKNETQAAKFGISNSQRIQYLTDVVLTMAANLGDVSIAGGQSITLPSGAALWKNYKIGYDPIWFKMATERSWVYNRYQAGNIFEVLAYASAASSLEGFNLPIIGVQNWKSNEAKQLGIHQLNYMMGLNPWDISFIYGIGDKNDMHPHHRQSNPDGRNPSLLIDIPNYEYTTPVGALYGGMPPGASNALQTSVSNWMDYHLSEVCLDGSATLVASLSVLAENSHIGEPSTKQNSPKTALRNTLSAKFSDQAILIQASLQSKQNVRVQLLDMQGRKLLSQVYTGNPGLNQWQIDLVQPPKGLSIIQIQAGSTSKQILLPLQNQ